MQGTAGARSGDTVKEEKKVSFYDATDGVRRMMRQFERERQRRERQRRRKGCAVALVLALVLVATVVGIARLVWTL